MEVPLENLESVGRTIRNARRSLGISQKELAGMCKLSQSTIARLETDIVKLNPSYGVVYNVMEKLAKEGTAVSRARLAGKVAEDIMHRNVVTINENETLEKAIKIVRNYDFAYVPVTNANKDVVGTLNQKRLLDAATQHPEQVSSIKIEKIIEPALPQVHKETGIILLKPILEAFGAVLVTEKGKIVGIITIYDMLKLI